MLLIFSFLLSFGLFGQTKPNLSDVKPPKTVDGQIVAAIPGEGLVVVRLDSSLTLVKDPQGRWLITVVPQKIVTKNFVENFIISPNEEQTVTGTKKFSGMVDNIQVYRNGLIQVPMLGYTLALVDGFPRVTFTAVNKILKEDFVTLVYITE